MHSRNNNGATVFDLATENVARLLTKVRRKICTVIALRKASVERINGPANDFHRNYQMIPNDVVRKIVRLVN